MFPFLVFLTLLSNKDMKVLLKLCYKRRLNLEGDTCIQHEKDG